MEDESKASQPVPAGEPLDEATARQPWHEGPDEDAAADSWLSLDDEDLLQRIETLGSDEDEDERLLEVVASHRHFFVRQEAAKRVRDRRRLFAYEDDRHVGQILVRHLNRREDITYLERLAIRGRHVEVRSAAQVQLARVWRRLEAPHPTSPGMEAIRPTPWTLGRAARSAQPERPATGAQAQAAAPPPRPSASVALAEDGVDASLLGWAAHFIVENAWGHLGTTATRELLRRTQSALLPTRGQLVLFSVGDDAHVTGGVAPGSRIPPQAVRDVADWMVEFRRAAAEVAPEVRTTSLRACTSLMADALRQAGFYVACDAAEGEPA
ncbi:MAG: hypothetical protein ACM3PV_13870 [Betaproteobacteria bacterium]